MSGWPCTLSSTQTSANGWRGIPEAPVLSRHWLKEPRLSSGFPSLRILPGWRNEMNGNSPWLQTRENPNLPGPLGNHAKLDDYLDDLGSTEWEPTEPSLFPSAGVPSTHLEPQPPQGTIQRPVFLSESLDSVCLTSCHLLLFPESSLVSPQDPNVLRPRTGQRAQQHLWTAWYFGTNLSKSRRHGAFRENIWSLFL